MKKYLISVLLGCCGVIPLNSLVFSQIVPDKSLGNERSIVNQDRSTKSKILIKGGAIRGNSLYHSFEDFQVKNGEQVFFSPSLKIKNIFTRVTGDKLSTISGLLGVIGQANLTIMNPNGIVFTKNSVLNVNGSFLATTATSIIFKDGLVFEAKPSSKTLLSVNIPVGLGFGSENVWESSKPNGNIVIHGNGHQINTNIYGIGANQNYPLVEDDTRLGIQSKNSLVFIGNNVDIRSGVIKNEQGKILIGAVKSGEIKFTEKMSFVENVEKGTVEWGDIKLKQKTGIITYGGQIELKGKRVILTNGSTILNQQQTEIKGGINIVTSDLEVRGGIQTFFRLNPLSPAAMVIEKQGTKIEKSVFTTKFTPSQIISENLTNSLGGDINITAKKIVVNNGGQITAKTFKEGTSGNITLKADILNLFDSSIKIGFHNDGLDIFSSLSTQGIEKGKTGSINIEANKILLTNGANIGAITVGSGNSALVKVNALTDLKIIGYSPFSIRPSYISSLTLASGDSGELIVTSPSISLKKGGAILTSTFASGNAGRLTIKTDNLNIDGEVLQGIYGSQVSSAARGNFSINFSRGLNLPTFPTGNSGDVRLEAKNLTISHFGALDVQSQGSGISGNLTISAESIKVTDNGQIIATSRFGKGGNIEIEAFDILLNSNGRISATSEELGDGGNIKINTEILISLGANEIIANAGKGKGGNIDLTGKAIILDPSTIISASSELGIKGNVNINIFNNLDNSLNQIPIKLVETAINIPLACPEKKLLSFSDTVGSGLAPKEKIYSMPALLTPQPQDNLVNISPEVKPRSEQNVNVLPEDDSSSYPISLAEGNSYVEENGRILFKRTNTGQAINEPIFCH